MDQLEQAHHHAARRLIHLLDNHNPDPDQAITEPAALATVEAIPNYAGINLLTKLMPALDKNRQNP